LTQDNQTQDYNRIQNINRIQSTNDGESLGYIWNILRAMPSNMPYTNTIETTTASNSEIISSRRRQLRRAITEAPTLYNNGQRIEFAGDDSDEENSEPAHSTIRNDLTLLSPDNTPFSHIN
jgi:hypothetical protein